MDAGHSVFSHSDWSLIGPHLRQDAGDGKQLGHQVRQVAVHEDEEGLNLSDVVGETRGERSHKPKQEAEEDTANPHHEEPGHSEKHVARINLGHVRQEGKHAVKYLRRGRGRGSDKLHAKQDWM